MPQPTFTQLDIKVYFLFGSDTEPKEEEAVNGTKAGQKSEGQGRLLANKKGWRNPTLGSAEAARGPQRLVQGNIERSLLFLLFLFFFLFLLFLFFLVLLL